MIKSFLIAMIFGLILTIPTLKAGTINGVITVKITIVPEDHITTGHNSQYSQEETSTHHTTLLPKVTQELKVQDGETGRRIQYVLVEW